MLSLYSRVSLIFVVLMSVCVPVSASAYGPPTIRDSQVLQSLGELLNADGSLNMNSGFTGSLDARGYQLIAEQNRAPRFLKIDPQVSSDVNWDDRFGNPGVNPDEVRAVAVSDIGIFVGGTFLQAAQVDSASILRWDGRRWHDMGGGVKYSSGTNAAVNAIVVSGNKVYVGGRFDLAGNLSVSNLAVWDGTTWADMAGGAKTGTAEAAEVFALTVKNGFVFVGGRFQTVGTVTANGVARWSEGSSTWSSLGTGLAGNIINPQGTARAFAQGGNFLYVGGEFVSAGGQPAAHIARWDTVASSWSALGSGMASSSIPGVYALAYDGSNLYAGGRFDTAGGVSAMNIAQWNGSSWVALGSGISAPLNVIPVRSLMLSPNGLLVGGEFFVAGGKAAMNLAYWNGAGWDPHEGVGMDSTTPVVYALAAVGEGFYAGGNFLKAGVKWINHIAFWSGGEWLALGQGLGHGAGHNTAGGEIRAVAVNQHGQVYVGGMFSYAGGVPTNNIARWDGANWHPLGSGVDLPVNALAVSGDDLYAGGEFFTAGGETVNNVARWNEADQVWYAMGGGVSNVVRALAAGGGWLYVGGDFITADSQYAWGVARWNLAEHQWQMLPASFPDQVWSIAVEGDRVVIGGKFETMALGGITYQVNRIVIWNTAENVWYRLQDNGSVGVFNNIVFALAIHGDNIYAGGTFASAGARPNTTGLARYDLNAGRWYSLGTGIAGGYSWVYSFEVFGDNLFVGGDFSHAGGQLVNKIARWDINNQSWSSLGSGLGEVVVGGVIESSVYALKMSAGRLNMGGKFVTVGGVPSHNFAQWQQASPAALALVTPLEGGTLSATDIQIQFPSQAVSESVTVSYTPLSPALVTGVKQFNLEAHTQSGQLVTNFNQNYTLAVGYSDAELAALGINENDLALSYWDGAAWVNLPAVREPENNRIVLTANHFSTFTLREDKAVVVYTLYLPTIRNK